MTRSWLLLLALLVVVAALSLATPLDSLIELRKADPALASMLVQELRLPRTLLALGYGAVLGLTGAALQATFANPLASPDITGSSSGIGKAIALTFAREGARVVVAARQHEHRAHHRVR